MYIYIYLINAYNIDIYIEYDVFPPSKESMLCVGVMPPTTMAPVQRRAPSRYQAGSGGHCGNFLNHVLIRQKLVLVYLYRG